MVQDVLQETSVLHTVGLVLLGKCTSGSQDETPVLQISSSSSSPQSCGKAAQQTGCWSGCTAEKGVAAPEGEEHQATP